MIDGEAGASGDCAAVDLMRRLLDVTYARGHLHRPITDPKIAAEIEEARKRDLHYGQSSRCWDCHVDDEQPVNHYKPEEGTWADRNHERWEVLNEMRAFVATHCSGCGIPIGSGTNRSDLDGRCLACAVEDACAVTALSSPSPDGGDPAPTEGER